MSPKASYSLQQQAGVTLVIALIFLLMITLFSVTSMRGSNINLLMASNEQLRIEASEKSQETIDRILANENNITVTGGVGHTFCATSDTCDSNIISIAVATDAGENLDYSAIRMGPITSSAPALDEGSASSASFYKATYFEVQTNYDGTSIRRGSSSLAQGLMILIPDS